MKTSHGNRLSYLRIVKKSKETARKKVQDNEKYNKNVEKVICYCLVHYTNFEIVARRTKNICFFINKRFFICLYLVKIFLVTT